MDKEPTIGEKISPILAEIEDVLWEHEATLATKPEFTVAGLRASIKIFAACVLDAMFSKLTLEKKSLEDMEKYATACGNEIRDLVFKYTGIDSHLLYPQNNETRPN